jgi:hypothetical protein
MGLAFCDISIVPTECGFQRLVPGDLRQSVNGQITDSWSPNNQSGGKKTKIPQEFTKLSKIDPKT